MPAGEASCCFSPYWPASCQNSSAGSECLWVSCTGPWGKPVLCSVYPLTKHWQTQKGHSTFLQEEVNWLSAWLCPLLCKIIKKSKKKDVLGAQLQWLLSKSRAGLQCRRGTVYYNSGIFTSVYYQQEANCLRNARQMALKSCSLLRNASKQLNWGNLSDETKQELSVKMLWQKDRALFQPQENPLCYQVKCARLIMNPDNNKRKWERMFSKSCKMHLPCTTALLQLCRHPELHTNSLIPSSGASAPLLACSPLTCALSNHCSGVPASTSKTRMKVGI